MKQIAEILKAKSIQIPRNLLYNYKKLNINEMELIILIYILNSEDNTYNPREISNNLSIDMNEVLESVSDLTTKDIIKIEMVKKSNVRFEIINTDELYNKLAMIIVNKQAPIEKNNTNIYEVFEKEFGRTLSPMEYEIIGGWLDKDCTEELILLALKEAVYNGVNNMRYIDRIIYEWIKKGIKTKQDVENNRKQFKKKEQTIEVVDYDWLNDSE